MAFRFSPKACDGDSLQQQYVCAAMQDIINNPDDDLPRLQLADLLAENGEDDRADFIRLQCAAAKLPEWSFDRYRKTQAAEELWQKNKAVWTSELPEIGSTRISASSADFRRGMPYMTKMSMTEFLKKGKEIFINSTLKGVVINNSEGVLSAEEVKKGAWNKLESLNFYGWNEGEGQFSIEAIRAAKKAKEVQISGHYQQLQDDDIPLLVRAMKGNPIECLTLDTQEAGLNLNPLGREKKFSEIKKVDLNDSNLIAEYSKMLLDKASKLKPDMLNISDCSMEIDQMAVLLGSNTQLKALIADTPGESAGEMLSQCRQHIPTAMCYLYVGKDSRKLNSLVNVRELERLEWIDSGVPKTNETWRRESKKMLEDLFKVRSEGENALPSLKYMGKQTVEKLAQELRVEYMPPLAPPSPSETVAVTEPEKLEKAPKKRGGKAK